MTINSQGAARAEFPAALLQPHQTMSSREIADLVDSRHDSVKRAIERCADKGAITLPPLVETSFQGADGRGQTVAVYHLDKRASLIVVAQLSPEFTARIVDRWQELEAKQAPAIPGTFAQALMLAAQQAQAIEAQQLLIEQQKPAVEFLDRFVEAKSTKSLREVAKVLGVKEREFITRLEREDILFRQSGSLLPHARYQHHEPSYFKVNTGEANGHAFSQTRFTPEGIAWIARRFFGGVQ